MIKSNCIYIKNKNDFSSQTAFVELSKFNIALIFGENTFLKSAEFLSIKNNLPSDLKIIGCSTSGHFLNNKLYDNGCVISFLNIDSDAYKLFYYKINALNSFEVGKEIAQNALIKNNLKHLFILSEGLDVNGSKLTEGLKYILPDNVTVSGGLAGDMDNFDETNVCNENGDFEKNTICVLALYNQINIGNGCDGGWSPFGIERIVTKSLNNIVYEIDNQPALDLYKTFLGEKSKELPSSALLFPLSMRISGNTAPIVRTILNINENEKSLTFAGDIPQNASVRLMKTNFDFVINAAENASKHAIINNQNNPDFTIAISCVGRKLILKQLVEEELDAAIENINNHSSFFGFYSYGEISPNKNSICELHNQSFSVTTFKKL